MKKLIKHEKKDKIIQIRLTKSQFEVINKYAEICEVTKSHLLIHSVLGEILNRKYNYDINIEKFDNDFIELEAQAIYDISSEY